jgi:hypothetical protein
VRPGQRLWASTAAGPNLGLDARADAARFVEPWRRAGLIEIYVEGFAARVMISNEEKPASNGGRRNLMGRRAHSTVERSATATGARRTQRYEHHRIAKVRVAGSNPVFRCHTAGLDRSQTPVRAENSTRLGSNSSLDSLNRTLPVASS